MQHITTTNNRKQPKPTPRNEGRRGATRATINATGGMRNNVGQHGATGGRTNQQPRNTEDAE
eukprot:1453803-Lingulodinium_polyedra.AAC.1